MFKNFVFFCSLVLMSCSHLERTGVNKLKRFPSNIENYDLNAFQSIISEESDFNLEYNHNTIKKLLERRQAERSKFSCIEDFDIAMMILSGEIYIKLETVNSDELIFLLDLLQNSIAPLSKDDIESPVIGITDKVAQRINTQLLYRKESVLIFSLLVHKYQNQLSEEQLLIYERTLRKVATYDSISITRRIAQAALAHLFTSSASVTEDNFLISSNLIEGELVFDGNCTNGQNGISYSFLEAKRKEDELLAKLNTPRKEISFEQFLIHECPGESFSICEKPVVGIVKELTKSEYDVLIINTKRELLTEIERELQKNSNTDIVLNRLENVINHNINFLTESVVRFESEYKVQDDKDRERLINSHRSFRELVNSLAFYKETKNELEKNSVKVIRQFLVKTKEFINQENWFIEAKGSFTNGVTSDLAYKNVELAGRLRLKTKANNENNNFWFIIVEYAQEDLLGKSLSKRVLSTLR